MNLENYYWDKLVGFPTEHRIDGRWVLRSNDDDNSYGSLRIVDHPDTKPGHLKAFGIFVKSINAKTRAEIYKALDDFQISEAELEVYSVKNNFETENVEYEGPFKELENLFGVELF